VLRRLGANVVTLAGGEIAPALRSGAVDAGEWIGPWADMALGLHKAARFYYYPGFHEPGTGLALGVNKGVWEGLDGEARAVIEDAAAAECARSLAEFDANNAAALRRLRDEGDVEIRRFDDATLRELRRLSREVLAEISARDALTRRIHASYEQFREAIVDWTDIAERAFLDARGLA
jgi:TRAP-type mannitol/chloroaromatic compound transport system substrate-binding protein